MADAIERGRRAFNELEETGEAFAAVRAALVDRLLKTGITDSPLRDRLVIAVQVLDQVKEAMQVVIDTGRIEEAAQKVSEPE